MTWIKIVSWAPTVAVPLVLLTFSMVAGLAIRGRKDFLNVLHSVPPRLALAATGIMCSAAISPASTFSVNVGRNSMPTALVLVVLFLTLYICCEGIQEVAKRGGWSSLLSLLGSFLALGLLGLASTLAVLTEVKS